MAFIAITQFKQSFLFEIKIIAKTKTKIIGKLLKPKNTVSYQKLSGWACFIFLRSKYDFNTYNYSRWARFVRRSKSPIYGK